MTDWDETTVILIGCHSVPDNTIIGLTPARALISITSTLRKNLSKRPFFVDSLLKNSYPIYVST